MLRSPAILPNSGVTNPATPGAGPPGKDGTTWTVGTGTPTNTANTGDLYLDIATGDVFRNQ